MKDIDYTKLQLAEDNDVEFSNWFFSNTIKDIINTMTGMEVLEEKVNGLSLSEIKQQISGAIIISGKKNIMLSLSMSEFSARKLVASITQSKPEQLSEEDLVDGVVELVNIIGGKIKAKLRASGDHYVTMLPFAVYGDNHQLIHKNKIAALLRVYHNDEIAILARVFNI